MSELSISEIGRKLTQAGRLETRPLCVYGSTEIPEGTVPSTSTGPCIAKAIVTLAFHERTPPIYVAADMPETCCAGGLAHFGFIEFNPGIKYFVSTGSKDFRNGAAEFLRATPELVQENQRRMGKITPPGRYVIIRACAELVNEDPGVRSILCFGTAERIRNMCSLVHFRSQDPFRSACSSRGILRIFRKLCCGNGGERSSGRRLRGSMRPNGKLMVPSGLSLVGDPNQDSQAHGRRSRELLHHQKTDCRLP